MHLDHVTIRTRDIASTAIFFQNVFGMVEGDRPQAIRRIPGVWLFADGKPMVHIIGAQGYGIDHAAEAIDHVGFGMTGYAAFRAKLERLSIAYSPMDLPEIGERRLFLRAPGGPLLETVFSEPAPQGETP